MAKSRVCSIFAFLPLLAACSGGSGSGGWQESDQGWLGGTSENTNGPSSSGSPGSSGSSGSSGSPPPSGGNGTAPQGDMFFRSVYATGSGEGGELDVVLYATSDTQVSSQWSGTPPASQAVQAVLFPASGGSPVLMNGSWTGDQSSASYMASDSNGNSVQGSVQSSGSSTSGSLSGPAGSGTFGGQNIREGLVATFCGTYSGSASGSWNFVVSQTGGVTGAFSGGASGTLGGSASGNDVSLDWSDPDDEVSGTASGSIDSSGNVSGNWSGSGESGTWQSSPGGCATVPAPATPSSNNPCGSMVCAGVATETSGSNGYGVVASGTCTSSSCCALCVATG